MPLGEEKARMPLIELLDPTSAPRAKDLALAKRCGSLDGKKIGLLSNGKANANLLLHNIEQLLRSRLAAIAIVRGEKVATEPAPGDVLERLRACDAVITAIAD
jgi:hypothetical protein